MMLLDHDDRLVVMDDEATKAFVWTAGKWVATGDDFPRKAWLDGEVITEEEAKERFPDADWGARPDLETV